VRSIAPALLLFASATSYGAGNRFAYPAIAQNSESESQESNVYPTKEYNRWDSKTSSQDYEETEESEHFPLEEDEFIEDEHDEEEHETTLPCIESCPIPCAVQKIYREQFINDDGEPLNEEYLGKMCDIVKGMEDKGKTIYEELEKLLPESVDEALAFGLKLLEGDKGTLELAKEALMYAVIGKDMWETKAPIEVPAEESLPAPTSEYGSASTSDSSDTNQLELSLPKDAVQDAAHEGTQTEATHSGNTNPETYEPELRFTRNAPKEEKTTAAYNAGASVWAEKQPNTLNYHGSNAPNSYFINQRISEQLKEATTEAPIVPAYNENYDYGMKTTPQSLYQGNAPLYTPRTSTAPREQHAKAYHSTETGATTSSSVNYPSVSKVESTFDENKHYVPATATRKPKYHHAKRYHNGGH